MTDATDRPPSDASRPVASLQEYMVGMRVHAVASQRIRATPEQVMDLYRDYAHWSELFPRTIRGTRLLGEEGPAKTIEVDHASAGKVIHILRRVSPREIQLDEFRPRYHARFLHHFEPDPVGTRYTVSAELELEGQLRCLAAIVPALARRQLGKFVLRPLKEMAEARAAIRAAGTRSTSRS